MPADLTRAGVMKPSRGSSLAGETQASISFSNPTPPPPPPVGVMPVDLTAGESAVSADRSAGIMQPSSRSSLARETRALISISEGEVRHPQPSVLSSLDCQVCTNQHTKESPEQQIDANQHTGELLEQHIRSNQQGRVPLGFQIGSIHQAKETLAQIDPNLQGKTTSLIRANPEPAAACKPLGPIESNTSPICEQEGATTGEQEDARLRLTPTIFIDPLKMSPDLDLYPVDSLPRIQEYAILTQNVLSLLESGHLSQDLYKFKISDIKEAFGNLDPVSYYSISILEAGCKSFVAYSCCQCSQTFSDMDQYSNHLGLMHIKFPDYSSDLMPKRIKEDWYINSSDWSPLGTISPVSRCQILKRVGKVVGKLFRSGVLTESHIGTIMELAIVNLGELPSDHKIALFLATNSSDFLRYLPCRSLYSVLHFLSMIDNCLVDLELPNECLESHLEPDEISPKFIYAANEQSIILDFSSVGSVPGLVHWLYAKTNKNYMVEWNKMYYDSKNIWDKLIVEVGSFNRITEQKADLKTDSESDYSQFQILKLDAQLMLKASKIKKLQKMLCVSGKFDYQITIKDLVRSLLQKRLELLTDRDPELAPRKEFKHTRKDAPEIPLLGDLEQMASVPGLDNLIGDEAPETVPWVVTEEVVGQTPVENLQLLTDDFPVKRSENAAADEVSELAPQLSYGIGYSAAGHSSRVSVSQRKIKSKKKVSRKPVLKASTPKYPEKPLTKATSKSVMKPSIIIYEDEALREITVSSASTSTTGSSYEPDQQVEQASRSPPRTRGQTKLVSNGMNNKSGPSEATNTGAGVCKGEAQVKQRKLAQKKKLPPKKKLLPKKKLPR